MSTKTACDHLREVLYHRLSAWDAAAEAERLLGQDVVTQSDALEGFLSAMGGPEDAMRLTDKQVLEAFDVAPAK